jgi:hypothetical protein
MHVASVSLVPCGDAAAHILELREGQQPPEFLAHSEVAAGMLTHLSHQPVGAPHGRRRRPRDGAVPVGIREADHAARSEDAGEGAHRALRVGDVLQDCMREHRVERPVFERHAVEVR